MRLCGDPPTLPDGDEGPDLRRALDWEAGTVPAGEFTLQEYVDRPALWEGRKFDLRW